MSFYSQYKKVNKPESFLAAKQVSSTTKQLSENSTPKETKCPSSFAATGRQQALNPRGLCYRKPNYTHAQTRMYKHPYKKPNKPENQSYRYIKPGNPYALVRNTYSWVNPNLDKKTTEENKVEEDKTSEESSSVSSNQSS